MLGTVSPSRSIGRILRHDSALVAATMLALGTLSGAAFIGAKALRPVHLPLPSLSLISLSDVRFGVNREEYAELGIELSDVGPRSEPVKKQVKKSVPKRATFVQRKDMRRNPYAKKQPAIAVPEKSESLKIEAAAPDVLPESNKVLGEKLALQSVTLTLRSRTEVLNEWALEASRIKADAKARHEVQRDEDKTAFSWTIATAPLVRDEELPVANAADEDEFIDRWITAEAAPRPKKIAQTVKKVISQNVIEKQAKITPRRKVAAKPAKKIAPPPPPEPSTPIIIATASQIKALKKGDESTSQLEALPQKPESFQVVWDSQEELPRQDVPHMAASPERGSEIRAEPREARRTLDTANGSTINIANNTRGMSIQREGDRVSVSTQNGFAWNFNTPQLQDPLNTQRVSTSSHATPRAPTVPDRGGDGGQGSSADQSYGKAGIDDDDDEVGALPYVEAFYPKSEVLNVRETVLSYEGDSATSKAHWLKLEAPEHWSTIAWRESESASIQVLSHNATIFLSKLIARKEIQAGSGIVFGEIASGWVPQLVGRSEEVILLDEHLRMVSEDDPALRYFVFLNVAPGLGQLYLSQQGSPDVAYITGPVLPNSATYFNLTKAVRFNITGKVRDATHASARAMPKVKVQIAGVKNNTVFTSKNGNYVLSGTTFGSYPIYLETEVSEGYTHRYRHDPRDKKHDLYRFANAVVERWYTQSTNFGDALTKGIAVGAFPRLSNRYDDRDLIPMAEAIGSRTSTVPRALALSLGGIPLSQPMEPSSPRMVAADLDEGLNLISVRDEKNRTLWSSYMVFHPNIVFVVGPN